MEIKTLDLWPDELSSINCTEIYDFFGGPVLMNIQGERDPPLMLSTLLHGNETSGFSALQRVMKGYSDRPLPRSLIILLGNPKAAAMGLRHCPGDVDFNRIWGTDHALARMVSDSLMSRELFACVDIHNNTGRNPHYACVSLKEAETLHLGLLFGRNLVYFREPASTFSVHFCEKAPSVVLECGRSQDSGGIDHVESFLNALIRMDHLPHHEPAIHDMNLYEMKVILKIRPGDSVGVGSESGDLVFPDDLDQMNFIPSSVPRQIAHRYKEDIVLIESLADPEESLENCLYYDGDRVFLEPGWIPSMFTLDKEVMKSDCLGYLMQEIKP